jgi:hypothetical protein
MTGRVRHPNRRLINGFFQKHKSRAFKKTVEATAPKKSCYLNLTVWSFGRWSIRPFHFSYRHDILDFLEKYLYETSRRRWVTAAPADCIP